MARPDPAAVLSGVETSHIYDSCNRRIQHGEKAGLYATWYDERGWTPRRTWCLDCCPETIGGKDEERVNEVILKGIFFANQLISASVRDRV